MKTFICITIYVGTSSEYYFKYGEERDIEWFKTFDSDTRWWVLKYWCGREFDHTQWTWSNDFVPVGGVQKNHLPVSFKPHFALCNFEVLQACLKGKLRFSSTQKINTHHNIMNILSICISIPLIAQFLVQTFPSFFAILIPISNVIPESKVVWRYTASFMFRIVPLCCHLNDRGLGRYWF